MNISNLERQHLEIKDLFLEIENIIYNNKVNENIDELVFNINILAGKLKIHMNTEDKLIYPKLISSSVEDIRNMGNHYVNEMGDIHKIFIDFKNKFNTKNKVLNNTSEFLIEGKKVFTMLKDRINKEDSYLYPRIKEL